MYVERSKQCLNNIYIYTNELELCTLAYKLHGNGLKIVKINSFFSYILLVDYNIDLNFTYISTTVKSSIRQILCVILIYWKTIKLPYFGKCNENNYH